MPDPQVFDLKAGKYDLDFTQSYVGKVQREMVYKFVEEQLKGREGLNILELNCGTGEDVKFLEQFGTVTATDVSVEMLKATSKKNPKTKILRLDLNEPIPNDAKYDVVFSNFGGLNCISPDRLKALNLELEQVLNPNGKMFLVFMHKWSLVESLYFFLKFKFKKAFRRPSGKVYFEKIPIYYYSKSKTKRLFHSFQLMKTVPLGVLLSGEYMNVIGKCTNWREDRMKWVSPIFGSDHLLYYFIK